MLMRPQMPRHGLRRAQQSERSAMETLIVATAMFAVGLLLGSRWQYRRLLRQIYESAHR
jgi:hypothetical protein